MPSSSEKTRGLSILLRRVWVLVYGKNAMDFAVGAGPLSTWHLNMSHARQVKKVTHLRSLLAWAPVSCHLQARRECLRWPLSFSGRGSPE